MSRSKEAVKVKHDEGKKGWASRMLNPFEEMDREFDSMFRHGWRHPLLGGLSDWKLDPAFEGKVPSVDMIDQDDKLLIKAELPG